MADNSEGGEAQPTIQLNRFSEQARKVLVLAEEEAHRLNHNYMGTEHLLLGLISVHESLAAGVLRNLGVVQERVRSAVEHIIGRGETPADGPLNFTPRAVAAAALAVSEAGRMQRRTDALVEPEHLLLGLLREGEGIAAGVLESFGVTLDRARAQTLEAIVTQMASPRTLAAQAAASTARSNVLTCRIDGRDLDALDALVEAGVRTTRSDAASWLIHAGIEANKTLLDTVYGTVAEIRRLREVAQSL
ncbi:MAG TPA: Clp protease N-terminal domain-containing protein, partial [Chloroflexota bacterium]|nr:Clp protease N-terminal domain-containing protein [Chloroflexota bacterium]